MLVARRSRYSLVILIFSSLGSSLVPAAARAEPLAQEPKEPSSAQKETARTLLLRGRAMFGAKDYEGAFQAFKAAHELMGVPTTGLDLAKAQVALGKLFDARETAIEVARYPRKPSEPAAFTDARDAAAELAEQLAARIPTLTIVINGIAEGTTPHVLVDGAALAPSIVKLPYKVNPGVHDVEVSALGYKGVKQSVSVNEGQHISVAFVLAPDSMSTSEKTPSNAATVGTIPDDRAGTTPVWPWIAGGVGVALLATSVVFLVDYANVRSKVASDCPNDRCDPKKYTQDSADDLGARWNRDLGIFLSAGIVGAVSLGAGIYGLAARPGKPQPKAGFSVSASPWIGLSGGGATFSGRF